MNITKNTKRTELLEKQQQYHDKHADSQNTDIMIHIRIIKMTAMIGMILNKL